MANHSHGHSHEHGAHSSSRVFMSALVFTAAFAVVEAVAGWLSGSLALLGDAGHMVTDSSALAMGALAAWISRQPPSRRHSFGLQRAEIVGALVNALFMLAVVIGIAVEAVRRLLQPEPVAGGWVMVVALIGLAVNLIVLKLLHGGEQTLNTRGAILHVLGDLLGSVAALAAGAVVYFTGWLPIDPILSLVISLLILVSTARLVLDVTHVLMEGVPRHLDLAEIGRTIAAVPGVVEVHDLHVWSLSSRQEALTAHVRVESLEAWQDVLRAIEVRMAEEFGIRHLTLQPEPVYDIHTVPASVLADQLAGSQSGKP